VSLVSDALKKAQRDAALRDARAHGLPEPLTASAQPFRGARRRAPWLPWTFAAAGLLALSFSGYLYFSNADEPKIAGEVNASAGPLPGSEKTPWTGTAASSAAPGVATAAATEADPASVAARREAAGAASAPPPPSPEASVGTDAAPNPGPPAPAPPSASSRGPAAGVRDAVGRPTAAGERSTRAPAVEAENSFVRVARLGDGGEIRLGGIAWSEVAPLAYLNGQLLGPGESVAGWRVVRIERQRVLLERSGESLRISLR
jgi:hypothetical protein